MKKEEKTEHWRKTESGDGREVKPNNQRKDECKEGN